MSPSSPETVFDTTDRVMTLADALASRGFPLAALQVDDYLRERASEIMVGVRQVAKVVADEGAPSHWCGSGAVLFSFGEVQKRYGLWSYIATGYAVVAEPYMSDVDLPSVRFVLVRPA